MAKKQKRNKPKEVPDGPFTKARVVRLIKKNAPDHMVSWRVKNAMNHWLGEVAIEISKKMNSSRYNTLDLDDFSEAVKRYKIADQLDSEKERLVKGLEKLQLDIEALKQDIERRISVQD